MCGPQWTLAAGLEQAAPARVLRSANRSGPRDRHRAMRARAEPATSSRSSSGAAAVVDFRSARPGPPVTDRRRRASPARDSRLGDLARRAATSVAGRDVAGQWRRSGDGHRCAPRGPRPVGVGRAGLDRSLGHAGGNRHAASENGTASTPAERGERRRLPGLDAAGEARPGAGGSGGSETARMRGTRSESRSSWRGLVDPTGPGWSRLTTIDDAERTPRRPLETGPRAAQRTSNRADVSRPLPTRACRTPRLQAVRAAAGACHYASVARRSLMPSIDGRSRRSPPPEAL